MSEREGPGPLHRRYMLFKVEATFYALPASSMVHSMVSIAGLSGTVPLRGTTYPVLDLRRFFRLPAITGECQVIFLDQEGHRAALLVDSLLGFEEFSAEALLPLPWSFSGREKSWFEALIPHGDGLCVLVHPQALLANAETSQI